VIINREGVEIEFGDGARDGDGSWGVERRQLGDLVVAMFGEGLAVMPRRGVGWGTVEFRHDD